MVIPAHPLLARVHRTFGDMSIYEFSESPNKKASDTLFWEYCLKNPSQEAHSKFMQDFGYMSKVLRMWHRIVNETNPQFRYSDLVPEADLQAIYAFLQAPSTLAGTAECFLQLCVPCNFGAAFTLKLLARAADIPPEELPSFQRVCEELGVPDSAHSLLVAYYKPLETAWNESMQQAYTSAYSDRIRTSNTLKHAKALHELIQLPTIQSEEP